MFIFEKNVEIQQVCKFELDELENNNPWIIQKCACAPKAFGI